MKFKQIEKIAKRISKKWGMEHQGDYHIVVGKRRSVAGELYAEVRTELTLEDGGNELIETVEEKLGYEGGYEGGCIYNFYDRK